MIHQILKQYWNYDVFRPLQEDIINSVLAGKDTLALLPTGGGKSICFQVPALSQEGICIVISPLIALMKDQVYNLIRRDIPARAIFSGMSKREIDITLDNCIYGNIKFLYVSPERLTTDIFIQRLQKMKVNLLAVDEAHCISQWGYDFRPPYLKIAEIRQYIPNVPVLALTASATPAVEADIQEKLEFKEKNVFRQSFRRENLSYSVFYEENKLGRLLNILNKVLGSGIIYLRNRRKTKEVAEMLRQNNVSADHYHAGLEPQVRSQKQEDWISGKTRIMCCTNAFGMGIDKPDVRLVMHLDVPDSLEAYYQEAGRAGRDGKRAYAVVLFDQNNIDSRVQQLELKYPPSQEIEKVYKALGYSFNLAVGAGAGQSFDFDIIQFIKTYQFDLHTVFNSLKILEEEGYIAVSDAVFLSPRLKVLADRETLYKFEVENRKMEPLLKLVLRSYEGAFENFIKIDEQYLAKNINVRVGDIQQSLEYVKSMGLIDYEPMKNQPQLTFLQPRVADKNLLIDHAFLRERKKIYKEKVDAIIRYTENKLTCRSLMIQNYFGEKAKEICGICDICLEQKRSALKDEEFEMIKNELKQKISTKPMTIKEITASSTKKQSEKVLTVVRWLLDNGQLVENELAQITWKS